MDHLRPQVVSRPSCPHVHMYLLSFENFLLLASSPGPSSSWGGAWGRGHSSSWGGAWGRGHSSSWGRGLGTKPLLLLGRGLGTRPLLFLGEGPGDEATLLGGGAWGQGHSSSWGEGPGDEAIVLSTYEKYIGHQVHTFTNIHHWCSMYFFIYAHVKRVGLGDLVHMH